MPTPAISLKLKKFRRRFGISAPRMVIRSHIPWQGYLLGSVLFLLLIAATVALFVQYSNAGVVGRELQELRDQVEVQSREIEVLRTTSGTVQSVASMERATQQKMVARLQALEQENASLKEDMLLFERLIPSAGEEVVLRIENFRIAKDSPVSLKYRFLLVCQGGKAGADFRGSLQFIVDYSIDGKQHQLVVPDDRRSGPVGYGVEIRRFLRREGVLDVPSGAQVGKVEVRVLQGDIVKAKADVQL